MMRDVMPVVMSTDNNYALFTETAIASIYANSSRDLTYRVYVLYADLDEKKIASIESLSRSNFSVICTNISEKIKEYGASLPERGRFIKSACYRLFIPELFPEYNAMMYVDSDVIFLHDVAELSQAPLDRNLIAAVREIKTEEEEKKRRMKLGVVPEDYFNSGVVVINSDAWRRENIIKQCLAVPDAVSRDILIFPDQDILNIVCRDRVLFISQKWNSLWHYDKLLKEMIIDYPISQVSVIHYDSPIKPWTNMCYELSRYFWRYASFIPDYTELAAVPYRKYITDIREKNANLTLMNQLLSQEVCENEKLRSHFTD